MGLPGSCHVARNACPLNLNSQGCGLVGKTVRGNAEFMGLGVA